MKKSRASRNVVLVVAGVLVLGILALVVAGWMADRRRRAASASIPVPRALLAHEALLARQLGVVDPDDPVEEDDPLRLLVPDGDVRAALVRIAAFDHVMRRVSDLADGNPDFYVLIQVLDQEDPPERSKIEQFVDANRDLIAETRRLAQSDEASCVLDTETMFAGDGSPPRHHHQIPLLAYLLNTDAVVQGWRGNSEQAFEDIAGALNLANSLEWDPSAEHKRYQIREKALQVLQQVLASGEFRASTARQLLAHLRRGRDREALAGALELDARWLLTEFERICSGDWSQLVAQSLLPSNARYARYKRTIYSSRLTRHWLTSDQRACVDGMLGFAEAARQPYYQSRPALKAIVSEAAQLPRTHIAARDLVPLFASMQMNRARDETRLDLARIGIALEVYYAEHGAYPAELAAIEPILGEPVPVNTLNGEAFQYVLEDGRFTVRSVCEDSIFKPVDRYSSLRTLWWDEHTKIVFEWRGANRE